MAYVEDGKLKRLQRIAEIPEMIPIGRAKNLLQVVEPWLRSEREKREQKHTKDLSQPIIFSPWASSRHMAYYR